MRGDQEAWKELVARYQRLVYSVARAICSQTDDVSDVFQQVWLDLYQHLGGLRHVEALPAWLMTVTRRRAYAVVNSRRPSDPLVEELPDMTDRLARVDREHMLERMIIQLSERCRTLISFLYLDAAEPSYAQIAKTMDMPEASIGPTRARCLDKLKKMLT
jgi:RNA polymerase sigma factor (sigma-70 family)